MTRYSYDGAGRLTGKTGPAGTETYAYDESGRLMSFTGTDGKQTDYTYNALGVLLQAGDTALVSDYASPYRNLLTERTNGMERRCAYGRDRVGVTVSADGVSARYSLLSDRLGSTERALDSAGRLAGLTGYGPWGDVQDSIPVALSGQRLDLTSSYTGYWMDTASGLWYAGNKMYSAQEKRFTSVDPASGSLADPVSGMPYLYARNNPYAYVDPSGRSFLGVNWDYIVDPLMDHYTYTTVLYCDVPVGSYMEHQRGVVSRVKQAVGGGARAVGGALTMLGSGALAAASGGTLTPISGLGVVVGAGNLALGSSEFFEAFTDHNTVRDTWMGGNQDLYNGVSLGFGLAEIPTGMLLGNALAKVPPRQTTTNGGYNAGTVQPGYQGQLALPPGQGQLALPAPININPWLTGSPLTSRPAPSNYYIEMAMSSGQERPGGWGTTAHIPDVNYARTELAITPGFKVEIGSVQLYQVPEGIWIQEGIVGPQDYQGITYPGLGQQTQILNFRDRAHLIPIGPPWPIS